jgi:hypothetical protein
MRGMERHNEALNLTRRFAARRLTPGRYTPSKLFVTEQYDGRSGEHDRLDDGH